jgi:hypothetical protein
MERIPCIIDDRERDGEACRLILEQADFDAQVRRLAVGDYDVDGRFLFERKTLVDLVASIKSGRLFSQALRLAADEDRHPALILEGTGHTLRGSDMRWEAIQGALVTVALFIGVPVLRTRSPNETVQTLAFAARQGRAVATGSLPRRRGAVAGETAILDVGVVLRGYSSDSCRTLVVGNHPTQAQREAHGRVLEALDYIEKTVQPGVSCCQIYHEVHSMLEGWQGWTFPHHLGHGIGLAAHEAPRLNPHWDDTFQEGDVFAAEPGLYGESLNAGIRIEQVYQVTATGVQRLLDCSTTLVEPVS